jgi:hypothetical protein
MVTDFPSDCLSIVQRCSVDRKESDSQAMLWLYYSKVRWGAWRCRRRIRGKGMRIGVRGIGSCDSITCGRHGCIVLAIIPIRLYMTTHIGRWRSTVSRYLTPSSTIIPNQNRNTGLDFTYPAASVPSAHLIDTRIPCPITSGVVNRTEHRATM